MSEETKTYEAMFLVDAGNSNYAEAGEPVKAILERRVKEILSFKPWDERKLAYEIKGRKRGLYLLSYFQAEGDAISELERDCQLDERVLRAMFFRKEKLDTETIEADTPATAAQRRAAEREQKEAAEAEKQEQAEESQTPDGEGQAETGADESASDAPAKPEASSESDGASDGPTQND